MPDYSPCARCKLNTDTRFQYRLSGQQVCSDCTTPRERDQAIATRLNESLGDGFYRTMAPPAYVYANLPLDGEDINELLEGVEPVGRS